MKRTRAGGLTRAVALPFSLLNLRTKDRTRRSASDVKVPGASSSAPVAMITKEICSAIGAFPETLSQYQNEIQPTERSVSSARGMLIQSLGAARCLARTF